MKPPKKLYDRAIVKLNLLLINDKTHEEDVRAKLFEVMDERNELGDYSTSDLHVTVKGIDQKITDFLDGLSEQTVVA